MSPIQKSKAKTKNVKEPSARKPMRTRSAKELATALLKTAFGKAHQPASKRERDAFAAFYEDMKTRHNPYLPLHFDVVQQATQLRWRNAAISKFNAQFFSSLTEVSDVNSSISLERRKQFQEFFEMMLRCNGLEAIANCEAALAEEIRKNNHELEEVEDWQFREGFKRGQIGYHVSRPIDSGMMLCYDEPLETASQRGAPPNHNANDESEPPQPDATS